MQKSSTSLSASRTALSTSFQAREGGREMVKQWFCVRLCQWIVCVVEGIDTLILVQCTSRNGEREGEGEVKVAHTPLRYVTFDRRGTLAVKGNLT